MSLWISKKVLFLVALWLNRNPNLKWVDAQWWNVMLRPFVKIINDDYKKKAALHADKKT